MNKMNRKSIVTILIGSMLVLVGAAVLVNMTTATPSSGFTASVIASGALPEPIGAKFKENGEGFGSGLEVSKIIVAEAMFAPGGTSGWHQHSGPIWVVISSGNLTFYDESCQPQVYQAPSAFFEDGKKTHKAVNEGSGPTEVYVTYMLPEGGVTRIDADDPGTCS